MAKVLDTAAAMGARIRDRREKAELSLLDLTLEIRTRLPRALWVTDETLRRYETGKVPPEKADVVLMVAIADVLRCRLADLSPLVADQLSSLRDLLIRQKSWTGISAA